jgi:hypothetical protein
MYKVFGIALIALSMSSCQKQAWQMEMGQKLDSMITLSESHEQVIASTDMDQVQEAFETLGAFEVFFTDHLDDMEVLQVDRSMYTGPLYDMANCVKYLGRVNGSYSNGLDPEFTTMQLRHLSFDVAAGTIDSAEASPYFIQEATALRSADKVIAKSYGGCFSCLRNYDSLVTQLDSLKGFILAPHAQQ